MSKEQTSRIVCFGCFQADLRAEELYKNGIRVKLQQQPFQILAYLLQRPGELVTREELRSKLWASDTFVDFEHSVNVAVKRLRDSLGDDAENPTFIETLPRRGYRFIATIKTTGILPLGMERTAVRRHVYLLTPLLALGLLASGIVRWTTSVRLRGETTTAHAANLTNSLPLTPALSEPGIVPHGTYLDSCSDLVVQGTILAASCQKIDSSWRATTLQDYTQCAGDIWNVDGHLSCDLKTAVPDPDLDPTRYYTHLSKAEALEQNGNYESAIGEYEQALDIGTGLEGKCDRLWLAHAYAASGDRLAATRIIQKVIAQSEQLAPSYCIAQAYAGMADDQALRWLYQAHQENDPRMHFMERDWRLTSLRSNVKFQEFARIISRGQKPVR